MIKEYLVNDLKFHKLYNAYIINTDDPKIALKELSDFLCDSFYDAQKFHPDFMIVKKHDGNIKNISVDQIRELQNFLHKTSVISGIKSVIIYDADKMTINAANSCLKILEDSPKNSYIFLITTNSAMLPGTIISRCAKINHFSHFDKITHSDKIDDYYIKPLLMEFSVEDNLNYLKEFSSKNRELWMNFTTNIQQLILRMIKTLNGCDVELTQLEKQLLKQLSPISAASLMPKYQAIAKLTEETITYDLDLKASYLLLINLFHPLRR